MRNLLENLSREQWLLLIISAALTLPFYYLPRVEDMEFLSLGSGTATLWQFFKLHQSNIYIAPDQQPIYFYLIRGFSWLTGASISDLRIISVLFYLATIQVCFLFLKNEWNDRVAFWMSLLLVLNTFFLQKALHLRFYTFSVFLMFLVFFYFQKVHKENDQSKMWSFLLTSFVCLFTNIFTVLLVAPIGFFILLKRKLTLVQRIFTGFMILLTAIKLYLATYFRLFIREGISTNEQNVGDHFAIFDFADMMFVNLSFEDDWIPGFFPALFVLLAVFGSFYIFKNKKLKDYYRLYGMTLWLGVLISIFLSHILEMEESSPRYFSVYYPLIFFFLADRLKILKNWMFFLLVALSFVTGATQAPSLYLTSHLPDYQVYGAVVKWAGVKRLLVDDLTAYKSYLNSEDATEVETIGCFEIDCFRAESNPWNEFLYLNFRDTFTLTQIKENYWIKGTYPLPGKYHQDHVLYHLKKKEKEKEETIMKFRGNMVELENIVKKLKGIENIKADVLVEFEKFRFLEDLCHSPIPKLGYRVVDRGLAYTTGCEENLWLRFQIAMESHPSISRYFGLNPTFNYTMYLNGLYVTELKRQFASKTELLEFKVKIDREMFYYTEDYFERVLSHARISVIKDKGYQ